MSNVLIWAAGKPGPDAVAAGPAAAMTLTQVVITAVAAITVFVAVLAGVLEVSRRRGRRRTGNRDARPGSFGRQGEEEYEGVPGYGRPAGYEPPPLWTDSPADPRSGWS